MNDVTHVSIDDLPDSLLVEILRRLPSKEFVFQCTSVSKRWCTLISEPYFIGRFLCLQKYQTPITPSLIDRRGLEFPCARVFSPTAVAPPRTVVAPSRSNLLAPVFKRLMNACGLKEQPFVIGTSNDLVLCCRTRYFQRDYYICNPYTRQWVTLPSTPRCLDSVPVGFICQPYFEEDNTSGTLNINKDYMCKVMRILPQKLSDPDPNKESFTFCVEMFSFETGEWTESIVSSSRGIILHFIFGETSFAYNGVLYWQYDEGARIIGLDPLLINNYNAEFCFIDVIDDERLSPQRMYTGTLSLTCLGVHRGCLHLYLDDYMEDDLVVWELKGDESASAAGKLCVKQKSFFKLDLGFTNPHGEYIHDMLAFDPNDDGIIYVHNRILDIKDESFRGFCVMYNIRTSTWTKIFFEDDPNDEDKYLADDPRLFQLVFPWWPTPVPRLPLHQ